MPLRRFLLVLFLCVGFLAPAPAQTAASAAVAPHTILFFGDSLTAGYGLENASTQAFPALVQNRLRAAGLPYTVVNAGLSGDTTAGGLHRIDWLLRRPIDILVLELGGNDGLRGLPVEEARRNLQGIIDKARARNPGLRVVVAGMRMPPNFGSEYTASFEGMYPALVQANPGATLIPFLLEGVGGIPAYNQADGIHPTAEGHKIVATLVWKALEPLVKP